MTFDPATERYEQTIPVLPEDIDQFDHVNNVVYVRWVQDVSTAHWNAAATSAQKEAVGWVVVRHEIDYINSARLGDEIIARTWVGTAIKNIFERHTEIIRSRDLKVLARARSLWCPIDLHSRRVMRAGPDIYERFSVPNKELRSPV
ncbi:MAG: acyl-CoA thioesterase [Bacteroidota bacterium]